jgi:hypothetical protein
MLLLTQESDNLMLNSSKLLVLLSMIVLVVLSSCENTSQNKAVDKSTEAIATAPNNYGAIITKDNAKEMIVLPSLFTTDTVQVKMTGKVMEVCQHSGCWLTVAYGDEEIMVNMKDEFSVPKNISGKTVWFEGIAYRELVDVETLKKIATESRKTQAEIDAITQPVYDYTIIANGVIVE